MVRIFFVVGIFITFAIQFYVPIEIIWPPLSTAIKKKRAEQYRRWVYEYGEQLLRCVLLSLTCEYYNRLNSTSQSLLYVGFKLNLLSLVVLAKLESMFKI